ncbi:MAG: polymer-forming cytoskeletal protein [Holophaga sp.]|nr:polymer-forming cytoskeletal protein [Holophaga sp.]
MFSSKKRPDQAQAVHTLLGKGTLWKGEIHAGQNSLRIEGNVDGIIQSEGEVTIAPSGEVKGTIEAKHLIVTGRVLGVFKIQECLEIHGTGYVEGEVEVGSLVVDEGGTLQGNCTRRGMEKLEKTEDKEKEKDKEKERDRDKEKDSPFVPFPTPPSVPLSAMGAAAFSNSRSEDAAADRHVFNMANGVPSLPPAGEHAYSKTKL